MNQVIDRMVLVGALGSVAILGIVACGSEVKNKPAAEVSAPVVPAGTDDRAGTPTSTSNVIKEKSSIRFVGSKVTGDEHGEFKEFDGRVEYANGTPVAVHFEIAAASVSTGKEGLDKHLLSSDFFDVKTYPTVTFHASSIVAAGTTDGATHTVSGELTLKGVTREVSFPASAVVTADGVRVTAEFTINRQDWNVSYKGAPDNLIRDEVLIQLDMSFPPSPQ